ncbi:hypothetical protein [Streptomyces sp. NPDC101166]|uniref:hypothetical protein n=1 Tax=Streptomyces sp. NPDC101166 TaxID=3366120 RepID=UPI0037F92098
MTDTGQPAHKAPTILARITAAIRDTPAGYPDDIAAAVHTAIQPELDAINRVREVHRPASDWSWKPLGCRHDGAHSAPCRGCHGECWPCPTIRAIDGDQPPPVHNAGPTVAECAADDRRWWDGEKTGER